VAKAVREWLESCEDAELAPVIEASRTEWKEKGGRPWSEAEREIEESINRRKGAAEAKTLNTRHTSITGQNVLFRQRN
jgi:hypothetical protein